MTLQQQLKKLQEQGMLISGHYNPDNKLKEKLFYALYEGPVKTPTK